jgi:hypothetical protein
MSADLYILYRYYSDRLTDIDVSLAPVLFRVVSGKTNETYRL